MHVHGVHTARPRRMRGEARHSARQHAQRTHARQVMLREDAGGVFIASLHLPISPYISLYLPR